MSPRILIAEDDELQGAVLQSSLKSRGYQAEIVSDGLEAVRRLCAGRYDLALLDYHLPEVDGLAAARLLHGFLRSEDRPRLIALTSAAEGLREREGVSGGTAFDAVVSKRHGLPALLSAIDVSLRGVAERDAALAARGASAARRRRRGASLAAAPFLIMAAAFIAALGWQSATLLRLDAATSSARRADMLNLDTSTLVDAVQDAEASQRAYVATGAQADMDSFASDVQRVERMLVMPASIAADGTPGSGADTRAQSVIETRLHTLMSEAQARPPVPEGVGLSLSSGQEATEWLRGWASDLVSGSKTAMFAGLDTARRNVAIVLIILAAGAIYGLLLAVHVARRLWRADASSMTARRSGVWQDAVLPPRAAPHAIAGLIRQDA